MYSPTDDEAEALGRLIRSFRNQAGLSLKECAQRIGVDHSTLSRFERGQRTIAPDTLEKFRNVIAEVAKANRGGAA